MTVTEDSEDRWFHYTLGLYAFEIFRTGYITRTYPHDTGLRGPRPCVWFSRRRDVEPRVGSFFRGINQGGKFHLFSIAELVERMGPLARLEVHPGIARWSWAEHFGLSDDEAQCLRSEAFARAAAEKRLGSDRYDWRMAYDDVPTREILGVEASNDGINWHVASVYDAIEDRQLAPEYRGLRARIPTLGQSTPPKGLRLNESFLDEVFKRFPMIQLQHQRGWLRADWLRHVEFWAELFSYTGAAARGRTDSA